MSRIPELKEKRNNAIRAEYEKLSSKEVNGKRLYRNDAILEKLSAKFFLAPLTIHEIVYGTDGKSTEKKDPNQPDLFDLIEEVKKEENEK